MPRKFLMEQVPISVPKPDPRNARTHTKQQVHQVADSIQEFGFTAPILIDEGDRIIAGHARRDAAEKLGLETVPVIRLPQPSRRTDRSTE